MNTDVPTADTIDPIEAEIIMQGMCSIPDVIDKDVVRTAYSLLISEYKDYAVGILDTDGRLICQCRGGLPIFVANALSAGVRAGLRRFGADAMHDGDVYITNDAGTMGQHLNNVVMYSPIRTPAEGTLIGFMAIVMHWIDVGGIVIGSCFSSSSTDIFQEGIQFPNVRLISRGERVDDMFRMVTANTRFPDLVGGDMESQIAGCLTGKRMVLDLAGRYGVDALRAAVERFWRMSEGRVRRQISEIADGEYIAESFLDNDGVNRDRTVPVKVKVIVDGDRVAIDLSGLSDQVQGPLNAGFEGGAVAAVRIACKFIFSPDEPANEGAFRPIEVICPPGKLLSAHATAAMGGSGSTLPTVVDTIIRAFGRALPDRIPAAHHGTYGLHVISGKDPVTGEFFQHMESTIGGWGAGPGFDGPGPYRSNVHGDTLEVPVELQEANYPYRLESVRLRPDSGGAGRYRGGVGVEKVYRMLCDCQLTTKMERTQCPPWGLAGGREGMTGSIDVVRADGTIVPANKGGTELFAGDLVVVRSAGGGGYGDPAERTDEEIDNDIRRGYVTADAARNDYARRSVQGGV
jgi:N-methylhydantoinase B